MLNKTPKVVIDQKYTNEISIDSDKLKRDYVEGCILENVGNFSNFFTVYGTSISLDTDNVKSGYQSVKITDSVGGTAVRTNSILFKLTSANHLKFTFYVDDASKLASIDIFMSQSSAYTDYFGGYLDGSQFSTGWNVLFIPISEFWIAEGTPSWSNEITSMQMRVNATPENTVNVTLDSIVVDEKQKTNVIFVFDDGWESQYTEAFKILKSRGFKGTIGVISSTIDTAGYLTTNQLKEIYNYGWDLANHTDTHVDLSTLSKSQQETELFTCLDYLNTRGYTRASDVVFYPYGGYNGDTRSIIETSYKMGRSIAEAIETTPPIDSSKVRIINMLPIREVATMTGYIDDAIAVGGTIILLAHKLVTSSTTDLEYSVAKFKQIVDYVYQNKNVVNVLTISEWANYIRK